MEQNYRNSILITVVAYILSISRHDDHLKTTFFSELEDGLGKDGLTRSSP